MNEYLLMFLFKVQKTRYLHDDSVNDYVYDLVLRELLFV